MTPPAISNSGTLTLSISTAQQRLHLHSTAGIGLLTYRDEGQQLLDRVDFLVARAALFARLARLGLVHTQRTS